MSKEDCQLRPNRSHLTTTVWQGGIGRRQANGRLPQEVTEAQLEYLEFLMKKMDEAGIQYPKPNIKSLMQWNDRFTITPNKRLAMNKKIGYLQSIAKKNGVDLSEWVRKHPKEVYKPYSATPVTIKKLSTRKENT